MFESKPLAKTIEALVQTKQTEIAGEYVTKFITCLVHMPGLEESYCLGLFLSGLGDNIQLKIQSRDASSENLVTNYPHS